MSTDVRDLAVRAREASHDLAVATRATKDRALHAMADALLEHAPSRPAPPPTSSTGSA